MAPCARSLYALNNLVELNLLVVALASAGGAPLTRSACTVKLLAEQDTPRIICLTTEIVLAADFGSNLYFRVHPTRLH